MKLSLRATAKQQTTVREATPPVAKREAIPTKPKLSFGTPTAKPLQAQPMNVSKQLPDSDKPAGNGVVFGTPKAEAKPFVSANKLDTPVLSANESPASAPARDIPEDMNAQQQEFISNLDSLYQPEVFGDVPLVKQCIVNIVIELQENPNFIQLIHDDDRHLMVKALIETLGLAKVKKAAKKRGTKKAAAKPRTTKALASLGQESHDLLDDMFAGLGGDA